jgi:hypothetical protein
VSTPNSNPTSYCPVQHFLNRADLRTVGDLLSDNDQRLTLAQVNASTILTDLLQEASGELEAACFVGDRYSATDIQGVVNAGGNGASLVYGIVAGYTIWLLFQRRPEKSSKLELPASATLAMEKLDRLRLGERILPIQQVGDAGLPLSAVLTPCQVFQQNLATTEAGRFFGRRGNQIYPPSGGN